jgi:predicted transcriptional regulator
MRCCEIMTTNFIVCAPTSHLCDLQTRWRPRLSFAIVVDNGKAIGAIPSAAVVDSQIDRHDPKHIAEHALQAISRCSEGDSLGYAGAKLLQERASAAVVCRDDTLLGVAALFDILQALLWSDSATEQFPSYG